MLSLPIGYDLLKLEAIDSTNAEALRRGEKLLRATWIFAKIQTAARGRRNRSWAMASGNFAATLALISEDAPAELALRSFTASLALFDAFVSATGRSEPFSLKWPNDVLLRGGKVAGILLETLPRRGLSIGFGVNLATAPKADMLEQGALEPVSVRGQLGSVILPEPFLTHLASAFASWDATYRADGFEPIRRAWLARAARIGEPVRARTVTEEIHGTFETVDMTGALVLTTSSGRRSVQAADVYF